MNTLIIGDDRRYSIIINNFIEKNYNIDLLGFKDEIIGTNKIYLDDIDISKYDIIIFPVSGVLNDFKIKSKEDIKLSIHFLENSKDDVLIFSGINTDCLDKMLAYSNKCATFLMKDKEVIKENVIPTIEGILADIIINTDITIRNSNIMVIGYGNIGKELVKILRYLNANVTVSIELDKDKEMLDFLSIPNVYSSDIDKMISKISKQDIIINTAPSLVLDNKYINYYKSDVYILDIASYPYGIDKEILDKNNIKNKIYSSIPNEVAYKTSGIILTKKINSYLGG